MTLHAAGFQFLETAKVRQVDDESGADNLAARAANKLGGRIGGAAGRNQVVDDENAFALADGILVNLDRVNTVFERVFLPDRLPG